MNKFVNNIISNMQESGHGFTIRQLLLSSVMAIFKCVKNYQNYNEQSTRVQCLYSSVCAGHAPQPHCWFSHDTAQMSKVTSYHDLSLQCLILYH